MADDAPIETPAKRLKLDHLDKTDANVSEDSKPHADGPDTDEAKALAPDTGQQPSVSGEKKQLNNKTTEESVDNDGSSNSSMPSNGPGETTGHGVESDSDGESMSDVSEMSGLSDLSGEEAWRAKGDSLGWVYNCMTEGVDPRAILKQILPDETSLPENLDDLTLWKIVVNIVSEPPPRKKLSKYNTLEDVLQLLKTCENIVVLTGAGVSVSCGIPDFRSKNGIYSRLAVDFPDLPDPQAMFDIRYFRNEQRPFYKFAKEIYPGQFEPSKCHKFIKMIEQHGKLLRNYTQNIDTLEQVAGISNVIQCHGSFATARCMACKHKCSSDAIKDDIMNQVIPRCPVCPPDTPLAVMKPDIVFFGESLPEEFHDQMAKDKDKCDLLIVIGSSLKVRPVALIPNSLPPEIPQILINKEHLRNLNFDVELLGDCDTIVGELCRRLGDEWAELARSEPMTQISKDNLPTPDASPVHESSMDQPAKMAADNQNSESSNKDLNEKVDSDVTDKTSLSETVVSESITETVKVNHTDTKTIDKTQVAEVTVKESLCIEKSVEKSEGNSNIDKSEKSSDNHVDNVDNKDSKGDCDSKAGPSSEVEKGSGEPTVGTSGDFEERSVPIEEARSWWKPSKYNLANRLEANQFCFMPPHQYIFPHAEYYIRVPSPLDGELQGDLDQTHTTESSLRDSDDMADLMSDDDNESLDNIPDNRTDPVKDASKSDVVIDSTEESKSKAESHVDENCVGNTK